MKRLPPRFALSVWPARQAGRASALFLGLGAVALLAVVFLFVYLGAKNGAVDRQEKVDQQWANVESQLQRRYDLVPNLVETVKGAAGFEQETLTAVTTARASVGQAKLELDQGAMSDPAAVERYLAAQQGLGTALSRLLVVAERYPELKATQNFADLQHQLEGTENRIQVARSDYNGAVQDYNAFIRKIPNSFFLSDADFPRRVPFAAAAGAAEAPRVDFTNQK